MERDVEQFECKVAPYPWPHGIGVQIDLASTGRVGCVRLLSVRGHAGFDEVTSRAANSARACSKTVARSEEWSWHQWFQQPVGGEPLDLSNITFRGPEFDADSPVIGDLPTNLVDLLRQINGFIQFGGGLHVRGVCGGPAWHSVAAVMVGPAALHKDYDVVLPTDAPFAQDCMADQFLLRDGVVCKLQSETGELRSLGLRLPQFFSAVEAHPVGFLAMQPLLRFQSEGNALKPGQVLQAYPPFCTTEARSGVSLRAMNAMEALAFLADFSRQTLNLADGDEIRVQVVP